MSKKKKTIEELLDEAVVTGQEHQYEIPKNWVWTKLGKIANYYNGKAFKSTDWSKEGRPIIRIQDLTGTNKGEPNYFGGQVAEKHEITEGDLLISWSATLGVYRWTGPDAVLNQHIFKVESFIDKKYHYYAMQSIIASLYNQTHGSGMVHVTKKVFDETPFPLPNLNEQKRIAEKMERLLSKIDEAKQLIDEAKEKFELRRAAILNKAFRGELTKKWRKINPNVVDAETLYSKIKESEVGKRKKTKGINNNELRYDIPSTWKWVRLRDIFSITSGGTPKRSESKYYEGDIPWIKTGEVRWNRIYDSKEKITIEAIANSSAKLLPINTVLVAMYGQGLTRGRASILGIEATCNQAVCALLPNEYILPEYLFYYFMEGYQRFRQIAKGGNQENLSATMISDFLFPLPPVEEQSAIIDILGSIFNGESKVNEIIDLQKNVDELKQSILSKAFRGELGTNDPSEENAIELLKEVLLEQVKES
ncbi:restriction endonuclease subunit S [Virgibacillus salexigens]|uniref:Type I restriction enzyme EcoEI specificity protein n=1 Tax=Virgibacillus kapii TaxID=1638645 RepID=A0ABQ2DMY6_9BACI|nr:restriction endonuclease subunit S [Virgibacillus kapii]GGJ64447.1 type I restriction enzyme EcoEI specificity protein [Virgibacillus kapii]